MKWFWIVASPVVIIVIFSMLLGTGGRGYFSPDTLEMKVQSEVLIPFIDIPIYRSSFTYYRYEIIELLIEEKLWTPIESSNPRWEFGFHWSQQWTDGGGIYNRSLGSRSDEWVKWTKSYPVVAKVFWPYVLKAIRGGEGWDDVAYILLSNPVRFETTVKFEEFLKEVLDDLEVE